MNNPEPSLDPCPVRLEDSPLMSPSTPRPSRALLLSLAALALGLTGIAALSAHSTLGVKFPSRVVDAYGIYSIVELPSWIPPEPPPHGLHRLLRVNEAELPAVPPPRALEALREALREIPLEGTVQLVFEAPEGAYAVKARVHRFGPEELVFFFITYALAAWVVLWSGGLVLTAGSHPTAARAYALWSAATFLFLISFYDHHTQARLFPVFPVSTVGILLGTLWLAYAFPKPPPRRITLLLGVLRLLTLAGGAAALSLGGFHLLGWDSRPIRHAMDWLMIPGLAILALSILLRLRGSTGLDRKALIAASWGLLLTPALIMLVHMHRMATTRDLMHLMLPFVVLIFPLSIGYALIRNNLLESQWVVTRGMLAVPLVLSVLLLSVLGSYLISLALEGTNAVLWLLCLLGAALFALMMLAVRRLQVRLFFPSRLAFRGTVGQLKDRLATLREIPAIRRAVEEAAARAFPSRPVHVLEARTLEQLPDLSPGAREHLARGEHVWTEQPAREQHLLIPMRSLGELRAVLRVGPRPEASLFTQEDLHLLETLASLGALALHNAAVVQELESLRRLEVGAARTEQQQTLSALGTEICHEMVYPLNFLRSLLRLGASDQPLEVEDLGVARAEIERMDRLMRSLREFELPPPRVGPLRLLDPIHRALLLLREPIQAKGLSVSVEVPEDLTVSAEPDSLIQLLSNLLRNAVQSTPMGGAMGIRYHAEGPPRIDIWDTGPGIPEELARMLFTHRVSTKAEGYGIGLTVVQRIARSFQWDVSFNREAGRTCFRLTLPARP